LLVSQSIIPFKENNKWGYKKGSKIIIVPEYDTAFAFDKTGQLALVASKSQFNKEVNPITGEEEYLYDYYYVNLKNKKIKILAEHFPDSMFIFPHQQELHLSYRDSSNYFKILFQGKLYLLNKNGKQLSSGFDNITETKAKGFFETENYSKFEKKVVRIKGLIDSTGFQVVKCKYHTININKEDSSIYCCSAVFDAKLNDDVFNYKGKLIYSSIKHIEFSSKTLHIIKSYSPREEFIVENTKTGETYYLDGESIRYLKNNKAALIKNNNLYVIDLLTQKKQKLDKETYLYSAY
jgi:hypothetical protein